MINVFFNIDENYISQAKTVMRSIKAHTNEDVRFYIIGAKKIDFNADITCYEKPDLSILKYVNPIAHITMASTYRLFAPFILPVDKVIYLDCDLIVLDDIKKLWDYDVKYIAGVRDGMFKKQARKNNLKQMHF